MTVTTTNVHVKYLHVLEVSAFKRDIFGEFLSRCDTWHVSLSSVSPGSYYYFCHSDYAPGFAVYNQQLLEDYQLDFEWHHIAQVFA